MNIELGKKGDLKIEKEDYERIFFEY